MERPWKRYGFGAFWAGESEVGNAIRAELGWQETLASAHNAWLDIWLSIVANRECLSFLQYADVGLVYRASGKNGVLWPMRQRIEGKRPRRRGRKA
jgi:hypothetical protein